MSVSMILNNWPALKKSLASLSADVLVGVPADKNPRREGDGEGNAAIAYKQDQGSPAENIPARPFMRPGIEAVQTQIADEMRAGALAAITEGPTALLKNLNRAGLTAQSSIRATINAGIPPPLSRRTIEERRARGRTGTKPLVDTGQLRNSITYVVRK